MSYVAEGKKIADIPRFLLWVAASRDATLCNARNKLAQSLKLSHEPRVGLSNRFLREINRELKCQSSQRDDRRKGCDSKASRAK